MARAKKTAAPPVIESPKHTAIKVLKGGASWHGGARYGTPTVTLRRRASGLDYRPARPVHLLADDGQVLTLAGDGSVSQAPVADETTAAPPADTSGAA